jgi:beta-N-acetylhexosaminidase
MKESFGRLMIDIEGAALSSNDIKLIENPHVGGLILFERNFVSKNQLIDLCAQIKSVKKNILISIDQEGGRVQRLRQEFTNLPSMQTLGDIADKTKNRSLLNDVGWLMASELIATGIDISFAPVIDADRQTSSIIGCRSFSETPEKVSQFAHEFINGMNKAGMQATGKHFPGHGSIEEDSHLTLPIDNRSLAQLMDHDLIPYFDLKDELGAIMCAHILFPKIDKTSAGFSPYWIQEILKKKIGFKGVIFSDDLSMKGASGFSYVDRVRISLDAGCDMVLICNNRKGAIEAIKYMENNNITTSGSIASMIPKKKLSWKELEASNERNRIIKILQNLEEN